MFHAHLIALVGCLSVLVNVGHGQYAITEAEANQLYDCFGKIICDVRNAYEFRRISKAGGPELQARSYGWFRDIYKMNARDDPEFWDSYPDIECIKPKEKRKADFVDFMLATGKSYTEFCKIPTSEECIGINKAMDEGRKVEAEYTEKGVCNNPKTAAEKGIGDAKKAGGQLTNMAKPGKMG